MLAAVHAAEDGKVTREVREEALRWVETVERRLARLNERLA